MAATDKPYRSQRILDIVFASSCAVMLLSVVWMFADDYYREYKPIQRKFRDVETALNERQMVADLPHPDVVKAKEVAVVEARKKLDEKKKDLAGDLSKYEVERDNTAARKQSIKADLDSVASKYDITVDHRGQTTPNTAEYERAKKEVEELLKQRDELQAQLDKAQAAIDENDRFYRQNIRKELEPAENAVAAADEDLKRTTGVFDRFAKTTAQKRWTMYDTIRTWYIIDAFNSPTRINQIVLNDLTIDYGGFRDVPRYDRCNTCHQGIDRANFSKERLDALGDVPYEADLRLQWARKIFQDRKKNGENLGFDIGNLPRKVSTMSLTPGEVTMYAAHPRLDLFVDSNSPHPMEKVGCTICHAGQGSATSFTLASHSPANMRQEEEWRKEHDWSKNHYWDFPMLSSRFVESSCLKCHHQVTDLVRYGSKEEAPKLLHGYNLVRELGCFGCHEIAGQKSGRSIGPDMRLEPTPALDWLSSADQEKAKSDPANPPGTYRKVGPSLRRLAEKSNEEWVRKWINSPRGFRPDTRMPHFYNLSNNNEESLEKTGSGQKNFPGTEMHSITVYLFEESRRNLKGEDSLRVLLERVHDDLLKQLLQEDRNKIGPLGEKEKKDLDSVTRQLFDLALLSVPAKAARINTVAAELKLSQDRLQEYLQEPEIARRKLLQDRQVAESQDKKEAVKALDESLKVGEAAFHEAVGLATARLGELEKELKTARDELDKLKGKVNPNDDDKKQITKLEAQVKKLDTRLTEQTRNSRDRREKITGLVKELRQLSRPTPLSSEVVSWDGTVAVKGKDAPPAGDTAKGRQLFIEKGCLACHQHEGTTKDGQVVNGEAIFGPNLTRLKVKLGSTDDKDGRRWLLQWILNPNIHHPRTRMPITQLSKEDAADIAAWLLSQNVEDWKGEDPAATVSMKDLKALARVYLTKAPGMTREDVEKFLGSDDDKAPPGIPDSRLQTLARDAEEHRLGSGKINEEGLKWYIGKKSITRLGCYACHDTPGFELAKPIGVPLNDWGKKDPDRLAFEDSAAFIRGHFNFVESRDAAGDKTKPDPDWKPKDGKPPMEKFFAEALEHHSRDGFLNLKLTDPRSYDYQRLRTWDDRLRMPQFKFARNVKRLPDEMPPQEPSKDASESEKRAYESEKRRREERYQARVSKEEAEAREAVMTFILGLLADPIPIKHLANPKPDKLAETKGRQVLEKFNCAGCHQVRSGTYDFKPSADALKDLDTRLSDPGMVKKILDNHAFLSHNAWVGNPSPYPDRMTASGTPFVKDSIQSKLPLDPDPDEAPAQFLTIRLTDALRFTNANRIVRDFPAGEIIRIPLDDLPAEIRPTDQERSNVALANAWLKRVLPEPYGGTFRDLMLDYTRKVYSTTAKGDDDARNVLPPPLIREGERVQPNWLFQFLQKPHAIRPQVLLRMPQFNMSSDDARAIVDYFTAVERMTNGSAGIAGSFLNVDQREEDYWKGKNEEYLKKLTKDQKQKRIDSLKPLWELVLQDQVVSLKPELTTAEKELDAAKESEKKEPSDATKKITADAQKKVDDLKKQLSNLEDAVKKKDTKDLEGTWEKDAYAADAYRLLLSHKGRICLTCHTVGNLGVKNAPPLDKVSERLRPEWAVRWIAYPQRMFPYNAVMPVNFPVEKDPASKEDFFEGDSLKQIEAVRDVLLNYPKISNMPVNKYYRPAPAGGKQ